MFRLITARRRSEDRRVDDFLNAIALSETYRVDPDWSLYAVTDEDTDTDWTTDTVAFPRILLAGTVL